MAPGSTRAVALLRGVNVGGNKRVPMADLRRVLTRLGYGDVSTLLNSGNAAFTAPLSALVTAPEDIEAALVAEIGVQCPVVVRTGIELVAALAADPLTELATDPARHLVGFLSAEPSPAALEAVAALDVAPDVIAVVGRHVYLWLPAGVSGGLLSKSPWERRLGVTVTSRNVNTIAKLVELTA